MQKTWVQPLVQEDPTCQEAIKPLYLNYWARMQQLLKPMFPRTHAPQQEGPLQWENTAKQ